MAHKFAAGDHVINAAGKRIIRSDGKFVVSDGTDACGGNDCGAACAGCDATTPAQFTVTFTDVEIIYNDCVDCVELSSIVKTTGTTFSGTFTLNQVSTPIGGSYCYWRYSELYDDVFWEGSFDLGSSCPDGPFEYESTRLNIQLWYSSFAGGGWLIDASLATGDWTTVGVKSACLFYQAYIGAGGDDLPVDCDGTIEDYDNHFTSPDEEGCTIPFAGAITEGTGSSNIGIHGQVDITAVPCTP